MKNKPFGSCLSIRGKVIEYWNKAGLCSENSSTSYEDPSIAECTNFVESSFLKELICQDLEFKSQNELTIGIDIGAGLGRFTLLMSHHLNCVYALEPAKNLYEILSQKCCGSTNILVYNEDFEFFDTSKKFDYSVVSGLLYFYDDEMVATMISKLSRYMKPGGLIIIRDFIIEKGSLKLPSSYVNGWFCHYRDIEYWKALAENYNCIYVETFQVKPSYPFSKFMNLFSKFGLTRVFRSNFIKRKFYYQLLRNKEQQTIDYSNKIQTVFITLKLNDV